MKQGNISDIRHSAENLFNEIDKLQDHILSLESYIASGSPISNSFLSLFTIFILSSIVGYFVVWKVTPSLHTALMSVTNAISSIIIIAAIYSLSDFANNPTSINYTSFLAVFLASINIFGGFFVTHRMVDMFKVKVKN